MRTELPKNWHIVITVENRPIIRKWWEENGFGTRAWNIGAFYGYNNEYDEPMSKSIDCCPKNSIEITFKEFERLVLNKSTEPQYEVY